jgi:hypothetical protein
MRFKYNELVEKFAGMLGTPKDMIEDTFAKPDKTDVAIDKYISAKSYGGFSIIIIFDTEGNDVHFLRAYRIYNGMIEGGQAAMAKMKPLELLTKFMQSYGIPREIPGRGEHRILIDKPMNIFFSGVLDIDRYLKDPELYSSGMGG